MELINNKRECCGCAACYSICPQKAIEMVEDEYGYVYPKIDKNKCIDCGLCKKNCVFQNKEKYLNEPKKTYVASSRNSELLHNSASGGVFATIAIKFLDEHGSVYGAALEEKEEYFKVKHVRVLKKEDLVKLQGSKYVQSDMMNIYSLIKRDLEDGRKVLFSGTPCQVNALKGFLKFKDYENLYTIDIICHGVPSNKMFNSFIKMLEKKEKGKIIDFKFRDKTKKWGLNASITIKKKDKTIKKITEAFNLSYYQLFLDSQIYRENCYNCPYAGKLRTGDITIGDYWKIEKEHPNYINMLDIEKGVSCIIVNNDKGEKMISEFLNNFVLLDSKFEKVQYHNKQLIHPSVMKKERSKILKLYSKRGYECVDEYYFKKNFIKNLIKKIFYKIPFRNK